MRHFIYSRKHSLFLFALLLGFSLISCSSQTASKQSTAWLSNGELSFGGPVPQPGANLAKNTISTENAGDYSYGFAPTMASGARSLLIDTANKIIKLVQAGKELASAKLLDTHGFNLGTYTVAHKQRDPLWYAPEAYFATRGLMTPSEGDKQRYLRGVFGDFALFVSPTEAIHSGPFSIDELSGARIEEQDFAKIFYLVEVGDSITVE